MSMGCFVRQEQKIKQMLKLSLRQELKLVLKLIIALIQAIKMGQKISVAQIREIKESVRNLSHNDAVDLAYETIRQGGIEQASELAHALRSVSQYDAINFSGLSHFAKAVIEKVLREQDRRHQQKAYWLSRGPRVALALRLILRTPDFLGGRDGTPESLANLLRSVPQTNDRSQVEWVLAGGWAVELLISKNLRAHHDIDALLMTNKPLHLDSDEQHTNNYFGVISCTRKFVVQNCLRKAQWRYGEDTFDVWVLCPEYLFLSKFLRQPRDKDWDDAVVLVSQFARTWDLELIKKLTQRNCCSFKRTRELMRVLQLRDPVKIVEYLSHFWGKEEPKPTMNPVQNKTVRQLKDQVLRELHCETHFNLNMSNDPRHGEFWEKLNKLGWQRKTQEPEQCADVDATAFISDEEYEALLVEARVLPPILKRKS